MAAAKLAISQFWTHKCDKYSVIRKESVCELHSVCRAMDTLPHRHRSSQRHKGVLLDLSHNPLSSATGIFRVTEILRVFALERPREMTSQFRSPCARHGQGFEKRGDDRGRSEDPFHQP